MGPQQDVHQLNGRAQLPDAHITLPHTLGQLVVPQTVLKPRLRTDKHSWVDRLGLSPGLGRPGSLSPLQQAAFSEGNTRFSNVQKCLSMP